MPGDCGSGPAMTGMWVGAAFDLLQLLKTNSIFIKNRDKLQQAHAFAWQVVYLPADGLFHVFRQFDFVVLRAMDISLPKSVALSSVDGFVC